MTGWTLLWVLGCARGPAPVAVEPPAPMPLIVLHTNDHHGHFWKNDRDEYGMAARLTLVESIRAGAGDTPVLLLSGGDINTGVAVSDRLDAEPDFLGMNLLGYDAMAVGNHEFDNPLSVLRTQEGWAAFPFLSANIYGADGERLFTPYEVFELGGLRVAVLGLTTDDTARIGNPEYLDGLEFRSPIDEARALVPELRAQADVVIALTHMGHYLDAQHTVNAPGDVTLAREVPGIDLVVGGHSQEPVCMDGADYDAAFEPGAPCTPDRQGDAWIVQAYEWGKYVGRLDLTVEAGQVTLRDYALIPVNLTHKVTAEDGSTVREVVGEHLPEHPDALALLAPYQERGQAELRVQVGEVVGRLEGDRDVIRFHATNLGKLVAHAQRAQVGGDVAVTAAGGVRRSLEEGPVTTADILEVQPFGNTLCEVKLTGAELTDYLAAAAAMPPDTGAFAQFDGVELEIESGVIVSARVGGAPIEAAGEYTLVISSFMASGGDGYPKLMDHPGFRDTGFVDAQALLAQFEAGPVDAAQWAPDEIVRR